MRSVYDNELEKIVVVVPAWMKDYVKTYCKFHRISVSQLVRLFFSELKVEHIELPITARIKHWSARITGFFNNGHEPHGDVDGGFHRYIKQKN